MNQATRPNALRQVGVISLGCDKNRVDTEQMLFALEEIGYTLTSQPEQADILIVNTCGFIADAQAESIEAILDMAAYKESGNCKVLLVTGCLAQRFAAEMAEELPEVDGFIGVGSYGDLPRILADLLEGQRVVGWKDVPFSSRKRHRTTPDHLAYVRIAEGCSNGCSYCTIPAIRGRYRSRQMQDILDECAELIAEGVKELVLVAQDTTRYGSDLSAQVNLVALLNGICALPGDFWVRVLYAYPEMVDDALLRCMVDQPKVCNALDVPIQHAHDGVLAAMRRRSTAQQIRDLMQRVRALQEDFVLRTTVIVGFPGETQQQFQTLLDFLEQHPFDHLGAFTYSQEEGTPAATLPDQLDEDTKQRRWRQVMRQQKQLAAQLANRWVGRTVDVLVEGYDMDTFMYVGRSRYQTPGVDGDVLFFSASELNIGDRVPVRIKQIDDYDWMGEMVDDKPSQ